MNLCAEELRDIAVALERFEAVQKELPSRLLGQIELVDLDGEVLGTAKEDASTTEWMFFPAHPVGISVPVKRGPLDA